MTNKLAGALLRLKDYEADPKWAYVIVEPWGPNGATFYVGCHDAPNGSDVYLRLEENGSVSVFDPEARGNIWTEEIGGRVPEDAQNPTIVLPSVMAAIAYCAWWGAGINLPFPAYLDDEGEWCTE